MESRITDAEYVSPHEAAQILLCSADYVRLLDRLGKLPVAIRTRSGRHFRRSDVETLDAQRAACLPRPGEIAKHPEGDLPFMKSEQAGTPSIDRYSIPGREAHTGISVSPA